MSAYYSKKCPVCGDEKRYASLGIHIVNVAKTEAFENAMGGTGNPAHLLYLRGIGWTIRKNRTPWKLRFMGNADKKSRYVGGYSEDQQQRSLQPLLRQYGPEDNGIPGPGRQQKVFGF